MIRGHCNKWVSKYWDIKNPSTILKKFLSVIKNFFSFFMHNFFFDVNSAFIHVFLTSKNGATIH